MALTKVGGDVIQNPLNVGIITATRIDGNVSGDVNSTGVSTFTTLKVGTGVTISGGIVTATTFSGALTGNATGLSGTPNITVGNIIASNATISGNVSVAGTLTYEDVTNVDSIGLVTARTGVRIDAGGLVVVGVTTVAAGSTAAPSITPTGDTDTGIFFPSADTIAFGEGGAEALRIDSSGNVGIGITNPTGILNLRGYTGGTSGSAVSAYNKTFVIGGEYNQSYNTGNSVLMHITDYSNDAGDDVYPIYCEDENNILDFFINAGNNQSTSTKKAYFGGNVGIGTNNPTDKLEVSGNFKVILDPNPAYSAKNVARIVDLGYSGITGAKNWALRGVYSYANGVNNNADGGDLDLIKSFNGNTILATKTDGTALGNVGIGTDNPSVKLQVAGDLTSNGFKTIQLVRSLGSAINSTVEIGNWNISNGAHTFSVFVTASLSGYSVSKSYIISAQYNQTGSSWRTVAPISNPGPYTDDFALEIQVNNNAALLRLRKTLGSTYGGDHQITILGVGDPGDAWTATSATGTDSSSLSLFSSTPLFIRSDNVGIGNDNPGAKLYVQGNSWVNNNSGDGLIRAQGLTVSTAHSSNFTAGSDPGDGLRNTSFVCKGASRAAIIALRNLDNDQAFYDLVADGNTNSFYIQKATSPTLPAFRIDSSGRVSMPYQPAFRATRESSTINITSAQRLPYNSTSANGGFDNTNSYSTSTFIYTAPVAGVYFFQASTYTNANIDSMWDIRVNGNFRQRAEIRQSAGDDIGDNTIINASCIVSLAANDQVDVHWASNEVELILGSGFISFSGCKIS